MPQCVKCHTQVEQDQDSDFLALHGLRQVDLHMHSVDTTLFMGCAGWLESQVQPTAQQVGVQV